MAVCVFFTVAGLPYFLRFERRQIGDSDRIFYRNFNKAQRWRLGVERPRLGQSMGFL
jgi:hypothetical protein